MTIFRFAIIFLLLCRLTFAEETVKIKLIHDTNLFETQDGQFISLSNVQTISINDSDSFRQRFALRVHKDVKDLLLHRSFIVENSDQQDSITLTHLWRRLPLGRESINEKFLTHGWGMFIPAPESDYAADYARANVTAIRQKVGMHNPRLFRAAIRPPKAIWFSGGLGFGNGIDHRRRDYRITGSFALDTSLNVRKQWLVWTGGYNLSAPYGLGSPHSLKAGYLLAGKSFYHEVVELVFSIGANLNKWWYDTESEYGIVRSKWYPGFQFKIQGLAHILTPLGIGVTFDGNINKDFNTYILSLNIIFGDWFE
jgi:hypothetical protein